MRIIEDLGKDYNGLRKELREDYPKLRKGRGAGRDKWSGQHWSSNRKKQRDADDKGRNTNAIDKSHFGSFWTCLEGARMSAYRHIPSGPLACILAPSQAFSSLLEAFQAFPSVIEGSRSIWALLGHGRACHAWVCLGGRLVGVHACVPHGELAAMPCVIIPPPDSPLPLPPLRSVAAAAVAAPCTAARQASLSSPAVRGRRVVSPSVAVDPQPPYAVERQPRIQPDCPYASRLM
uniref:Uncharacterized protein n=1 Tax=Cucumis melo TaxID=3656 RepID=A0A9I9EEZ9_CUCME